MKIRIPALKVPKFVPGAGFKAAEDPKAAKRKTAKGGTRSRELREGESRDQVSWLPEKTTSREPVVLLLEVKVLRCRSLGFHRNEAISEF